MRRSITFGILLAGTTAAMLAAAQTSSTRGAYRLDLKLPGANPVPRIEAAGAAPVVVAQKVCSNSLPCETPVLVYRGGVDKVVAGKWDTNGCTIHFPYGLIRVIGQAQPEMRWNLVKDPSDDTRYRFHPEKGIDFAFRPGIPVVDLDRDFYNPHVEKDGMVFVWRNLNRRKRPSPASPSPPFSFAPSVQQWDKEAKQWKGCDWWDPEILNEN